MFGNVTKRRRLICATTVRPCIVAVGLAQSELMRVTRILNNGSMLEYRLGKDLRTNPPQCKVEMFLISASSEPLQTQKMLRWVRRNWLRCPITVIADTETCIHERLFRGYGAWFLPRPLSDINLMQILQSITELPPMVI